MKIKFLKFIDTFAGKILCLFLGYLDYLFNWTTKEARVPEQPQRILIIRPGGMGDFLYLLPTLKLLKARYPQVQIHILAEKRNRAVKDLTNIIDKMLCYDSNPFATLISLRQEKYDVVIDSEQFHNFSALFSYLTSAKVRIGFKTNPFRNHLYTHLIDYTLRGFEAVEFARLLEPLEIKTKEAPLIMGILHDKILSTPLPTELTDLKARHSSIILIAPQGTDKYRFWAPEKYQQVIKALVRNPQQAVAIIGSKSERKFTEKIIRGLPDRKDQIISLVGKTSFLELGRIITESALFVGCDSGSAILTSMLGAKSLVLFGSTDEKKWGLENSEHVIVKKEMACAPCYMLGSHKYCKRIDCMEKISPADVISAINQLGFN
ncbi:MAG: glycosyltransferase family 9 protein [Candidatus Margulisbacteria bacterium]|nr:glycosyltransferase family 9 protein [Candidatus Margulisiibacteriota bacterium]